MRKSITLVTAPGAQPITLPEAKTWARIDGNDDDALITQLIDAATQSAEAFLRRSLISQTYRLTIDLPTSACYDSLGEGVYDLPVSALYGNLPRVIELPRGPASAISSVKTYDTDNAESTYDSANYTIDADGSRLILVEGAQWPSNMRPEASVAITFVAGYGATPSSIPQPIKTALMIHVATLYEQRGQCDMDLPAPSKQLLSQYRRMGVPL